MDDRYTYEDLKVMQAWTLERKIRVTQAKIMEFYEHYEGRVTISFSGGKDSTVLLDLARRCYPNIEAVYVDTGLDFPEVRSFVLEKENVTRLKSAMRFDKVVEKYGWCYPSKDVATAIYYYRRGSPWAMNYMNALDENGCENQFKKDRFQKFDYLLDAPFIISSKCCQIMKERPMAKYERSTKTHPIIGTLASESKRRKRAWAQTGCNLFEGKTPISKPLSFWTEQDVLTYIKMFDIPIASVYGEIVQDSKGKLHTTAETRTGCIFCPIGCHLEKEPNRWQRLKISHPQLYDYCMDSLGLGAFLDYIKVKK